MSLPPIPRAKATTSLPTLPGANKPSPAAPSLPAVPASRKEARRANDDGGTKEILAITVEDDNENPDAISISFAGAGFDIENDEIVIDLLRLAANSYGYDLFEMPEFGAEG
jgi:hypothetical protein